MTHLLKQAFAEASKLPDPAQDLIASLVFAELRAAGPLVPRPTGLCAGEFVVPDDFDAALPESVLAEFYQQ